MYVYIYVSPENEFSTNVAVVQNFVPINSD